MATSRPHKRRRISVPSSSFASGLNSRFDRMMDRLVGSEPSSVKPRKKTSSSRARSSSSGVSYSSYDGPRTPSDFGVDDGRTSGRLGNEFAVMKMKSSETAWAKELSKRKRAKEQDDEGGPKPEASDEENEPHLEEMPDWLRNTFSMLDHNHPLRALGPSSPNPPLPKHSLLRASTPPLPAYMPDAPSLVVPGRRDVGLPALPKQQEDTEEAIFAFMPPPLPLPDSAPISCSEPSGRLSYTPYHANAPTIREPSQGSDRYESLTSSCIHAQKTSNLYSEEDFASLPFGTPGPGHFPPPAFQTSRPRGSSYHQMSPVISRDSTPLHVLPNDYISTYTRPPHHPLLSDLLEHESLGDASSSLVPFSKPGPHAAPQNRTNLTRTPVDIRRYSPAPYRRTPQHTSPRSPFMPLGRTLQFSGPSRSLPSSEEWDLDHEPGEAYVQTYDYSGLPVGALRFSSADGSPTNTLMSPSYSRYGSPQEQPASYHDIDTGDEFDVEVDYGSLDFQWTPFDRKHQTLDFRGRQQDLTAASALYDLPRNPHPHYDDDTEDGALPAARDAEANHLPMMEHEGMPVSPLPDDLGLGLVSHVRLVQGQHRGALVTPPRYQVVDDRASSSPDRALPIATSSEPNDANHADEALEQEGNRDVDTREPEAIAEPEVLLGPAFAPAPGVYLSPIRKESPENAQESRDDKAPTGTKIAAAEGRPSTPFPNHPQNGRTMLPFPPYLPRRPKIKPLRDPRAPVSEEEEAPACSQESHDSIESWSDDDGEGSNTKHVEPS